MQNATVTNTQALSAAMAQGLERLDAQLLLLHVLARQPIERGWLLAHGDETLSDESEVSFRELTKQRANGMPLPYLTGHIEFFGLDLQVDPRVLVPRPDTETLVEWALQVIDSAPAAATLPACRVIDLGTGSGAVALALKHARPAVQMTATDLSAAALQVARANSARLQLDVDFKQGAWLADVPGAYDVIVSNPPYIPAHDPHLPALAHEPLSALVSGKKGDEASGDGLDDIRKIITQAPAHLNLGGWLLLEHGYDQAARVRDLLALAGFQNVQSRRDLAGIERCSGGRVA